MSPFAFAADQDQPAITAIRCLSMDAVEAANSGHPGTPMALAPLSHVLWSRFIRYNPADAHWADRDRFVLSCGHASMLLYAQLHLAGFALPLEELRRFRQWGSATPGHPEWRHTPGVETTTGPLGQGFANAVGMAIAETHLAAEFNRENFPIVDHYTYVVASDGDLMEGVASEAASLAGHLRLGKLIVFYDDNRITIDGSTDLTFSEDVGARFAAYGWQVLRVDDANDVTVLERATQEAHKDHERPTLVIVRSHIAWGSPNKQGTSEAHGAPLGATEVQLTKQAYGLDPHAAFVVPEGVRAAYAERAAAGKKAAARWNEMFLEYERAFPELAREWRRRQRGENPAGWDRALPSFAAGKTIATRKASGEVMQAIAKAIPEFMGGSADLACSNNTTLNGLGDFSATNREGRNLHFGIREHAMGSVCNGLALHGGILPFAATFFVFTDYMRPAMRLAALMGLPVSYVLTHDSIGLGEDGPTHQPIEHLMSLRAMPNMHVIRPADATETVGAWKCAVSRNSGPTALILSRQNLPTLATTNSGSVARGAYILADAQHAQPQVIIIATGSEVQTAMEAHTRLSEQGIAVRVVSMPCWELFAQQSADYREQVLPATVTARVSIEAGATFGWERHIGERGIAIGIDRFGASAPASELFKQFGLTVERVCDAVKSVLAKK